MNDSDVRREYESEKLKNPTGILFRSLLAPYLPVRDVRAGRGVKLYHSVSKVKDIKLFRRSQAFSPILTSVLSLPVCPSLMLPISSIPSSLDRRNRLPFHSR